jgi:hypothetical protein
MGQNTQEQQDINRKNMQQPHRDEPKGQPAKPRTDEETPRDKKADRGTPDRDAKRSKIPG